MRLPLIIAAVLAGSAALAGCGKSADLERPAPMFGNPQPPSEQTISRQDAEARARFDAARSNEADAGGAPQSIQELRNRNQPVPPQREDGIHDVTGFNPGQSQPQGSIPDPYGHPSSTPQ
jgi:hypothetical protein